MVFWVNQIKLLETMKYLFKRLNHKRYFLTILIASLVLIISCEDENQNPDSEKIPGRYAGSLRWFEYPDAPDQISVYLDATLNIKNDYYSLVFDSHPKIHLPQLNLKVYEIINNKHRFHVMENSSYSESNSFNYFLIYPEWDIHQSVKLKLSIKSIDPDSVYYIYYQGENPF